MRKSIQKGLLILALLLGCILPSNNAMAGDYGEPPWVSNEGKDPAMADDGTITYVTLDRTATSLIRYGTLGFTVKAYESEKGKGDSTPSPTGKGKDTLMYGKNTTKESFVSGLDTYTQYTFKKKDVMAAFSAAGVTQKTLSDTKNHVYLNHIFIFKWYASKTSKTPYKTVKPLYDEQTVTYPYSKYGFSWADPSGIKSHFNIPVKFKVDVPVYITQYIKEGTTLKKYKTEKETIKSTEYKTDDSTVPEIIQKDGKTYYLYRSSYSSLANEEKEQNNGTDGKYRKQTGLVYNLVNPLIDRDLYDKQLKEVRRRAFKFTDFDGIEITYWYRAYSVKKPSESSKEKEYLEPYPSGTINSMSKGAETYDSMEGIPTTESQYVNLLSENYLISYKFVNKTGTNYYRQKYFYTEIETNDKGEKVEVTKSDYKLVDRSYSYWKIEEFKVYSLVSGTVENYSLPNGKVTVPTTSKYIPPSVSYTIYDTNLKDPEGIETEEVGKIQVRNDKLIFNGTVIMDSSYEDEKTSEPGEIENPKKIADESMFIQNQLIDATKANGEYESSGTVSYRCIANAGGSTGGVLTFGVDNINNVIIHTPTICQGKISGAKQYNQMLMPNQGIESLVLDRYFSVTFPSEGWHSDLKGYGFRDYARYIYSNEVRFPFDVYKGSTYYPANTWLIVSSSESYYLPTWVSEGVYTVEYRSRTINCNANDGLDLTEYDANTDYSNYVAVSEEEVEVSGRLFGLTQYDISNYPLWRDVFRKTNSLETTGFTYKIGTRDQNGLLTGRLSKYTFPILNGGHPLFNNIGVQKLGYVSRFYLTTIGGLTGDKDTVTIVPRFYYVSNDGNVVKEVDVYYSETINGKKKSLVKVNSDIDLSNVKNMTLGNAYTAVPESELSKKATLVNKSLKEIKASTANVYTFGKIKIPEQMRTYIGASFLPNGTYPSGLSKNLVDMSVQKWYFDYYLPSEIHVCVKDYDVEKYMKDNGAIDYSEPFWLKNGYLKISFGITTTPIDRDESRLSYINSINASSGYCNMWQTEGFQYIKRDVLNTAYSFNDGDTLLYYLGNTNGTAADDYISGGTH